MNPQKKLTAVIQNFTWGVASSPKSLFPSGLTVDPRTNSLVLNSRTGHVQFFNTHTKSLLYNVSNIIQIKWNTQIPNKILLYFYFIKTSYHIIYLSEIVILVEHNRSKFIDSRKKCNNREYRSHQDSH